jgi:hypothetical protein
VGFEQEVACVDQIELGVGQVAQESPRASNREKWVVLSPQDQCRRLPLSEIPFERGVERNIGLIVAEQVDLSVGVAWPG